MALNGWRLRLFKITILSILQQNKLYLFVSYLCCVIRSVDHILLLLVVVFPTKSRRSTYAAKAAASSNTTGLTPSLAECLLLRL